MRSAPARRILIAVAIAASAALGQAAPQRATPSECAGRVCWPRGQRPRWLDSVSVALDGGTWSIASGTLNGSVTLTADAALDPRGCALEVEWRGTHHGQVSLAPPDMVSVEGHRSTAHWNAHIPLTGSPIAVEWNASVRCAEGVSFDLSASGDVVTSDDALTFLCPPRTPFHPGSPRVRLNEGLRVIRLSARAGVVLRRDGTRVYDLCTRRTLFDLASLGIPATAPEIPEGTSLQSSERVLALEVAAGRYSDMHAGRAGPPVDLSFARPLDRSALRVVTRTLGGVRGIADLSGPLEIVHPF